MGTIGIRGTTFVVQVDGVGGVEITIVEGAIFVTLPDGEVYELDDSGDFLTVDSAGRASPVVEGDNERLDALRQDTGFQLALSRAQQAVEVQGDGQEDGPAGMDPGDGGVDGSSNGSQQQDEGANEGRGGTDSQPPGTQGASGGQGGTAGDASGTQVVNAIPVFAADEFFFSLPENQDGSTTAIGLGAVTASDDDEGDTLTYSILPQGDASDFTIDAVSGALSYTGSGEDYENDPELVLQVTVRVSDGTHTADVPVTVAITDVNEAPVFGASSYAFDLAENTDGSNVPVALGSVSAIDPDGDALAYSIVGGGGDYAIDSATGQITYVGSGEDHETNSSDTLTVRASDGTLSADVSVTVAITDVEDTDVEEPDPTDPSLAGVLSLSLIHI